MQCIKNISWFGSNLGYMNDALLSEMPQYMIILLTNGGKRTLFDLITLFSEE